MIALLIIASLGCLRLIFQSQENMPTSFINFIVQLFFIDYIVAIVEHIRGK